MEKQKLLYQQARLHDRGAAEMVLQTISASKGNSCHLNYDLWGYLLKKSYLLIGKPVVNFYEKVVCVPLQVYIQILHAYLEAYPANFGCDSSQVNFLLFSDQGLESKYCGGERKVFRWS